MNKNIIHIILNYFKDKLSNKERHDLEKEVNTDPFLQDAMDGFAGVFPHELEKDLQILTNSLNKLTEIKKTRKLIPYIRIAAGIALLIGIGTTILYTGNSLNKSKLAEHTQKESIEEEIIPIKHAGYIKVVHKEEEIASEPINNRIALQKEKKAMPVVAESKPPMKNKKTTVNKITIIEEIKEKEEILAEVETDYKADSKNKAMAAPQSYSANQEVNVATVSYTSQSGAKMVLAAKVQGVVISDSGEPIPFANITIKGTNKGVVSDIDGNFRIEYDMIDTLQIAYIGYETKEIPAEVVMLNNATIRLNANALALEEVVVDSYSADEESAIAGSTGAIEDPSRGIVAGVSIEKEKKRRNGKYKLSGTSKNTEIAINTQPRTIVGLENFHIYIDENKKISNTPPIEITVIFVVSTDGNLSNFKTIDNPNHKLTNEAIRLIKEGPQWQPAIINGETIEHIVTLIIEL